VEFLEYWRLCERPFEPAWDARFFYQSRAHNEALHRLDFVAGEQSMLLGMLTGDIGCGKTLTRAVFSGLLDQRQFRVVTQENSSFGFNDLLGLTLRALNGGEERAIGRSKAVRWELF
jgi:general secretion pathway protein A